MCVCVCVCVCVYVCVCVCVCVCVWGGGGGGNRFRVMIDFLRDGSARPVFCKTLPAFSGLNAGDMFEMFDMLY